LCRQTEIFKLPQKSVICARRSRWSARSERDGHHRAGSEFPSAGLHTRAAADSQTVLDTINYGKIFTKINGESAGNDSGRSLRQRCYIVNCESRPQARFRFPARKNVVEIYAIDRAAILLCVYVLSRRRTAGDQTLSATVENVPLNVGSDRHRR